MGVGKHPSQAESSLTVPSPLVPKVSCSPSQGSQDKAGGHPSPQPRLTPPYPSQGSRGELLLSLCYNPSANSIIVNIIKARNLKAMDIGGTSGAGASRPRGWTDWGALGTRGAWRVWKAGSELRHSPPTLFTPSLVSTPLPWSPRGPPLEHPRVRHRL